MGDAHVMAVQGSAGAPWQPRGYMSSGGSHGWGRLRLGCAGRASSITLQLSPCLSAPYDAKAPFLPLAASICLLHMDCSAVAVTGETPRLSPSDAELTLQIMALNSGSANRAEMCAVSNLIECHGSTTKVWCSLFREDRTRIESLPSWLLALKSQLAASCG